MGRREGVEGFRQAVGARVGIGPLTGLMWREGLVGVGLAGGLRRGQKPIAELPGQGPALRGEVVAAAIQMKQMDDPLQPPSAKPQLAQRGGLAQQLHQGVLLGFGQSHRGLS